MVASYDPLSIDEVAVVELEDGEFAQFTATSMRGDGQAETATMLAGEIAG